MKGKNLLILILFAGIGTIAAGQEMSGCSYQELSAGDPVTGVLAYTEGNTDFVTYCLQVPEDVFSVRLTLSGAQADLDLFCSYGEEIESYDEVDFSSAADTYFEEIFISRFSDPPLETGIYYIDVAYQIVEAPMYNEEVLANIPFQIEAIVQNYGIEQELQPGKGVRSSLSVVDGLVRMYKATVSESAKVMRIDLFDSPGDIDLAVNFGDFTRSLTSSDYVLESYLGRESIVLGGSSGKPLYPGDYYITVFDQVSNRRQERFSIIMDFSEEPPPFLLYIPPFPAVGPGLHKALLPTVEITTHDGRGSGCIVSPEGHVLTNWHVIEALDGGVSTDLYIGASFSPSSPPVELFSAELIEADRNKDLALLKITSGRYSQPLPSGYQFPYFDFSDSREIQIGEEILILGYPAMGSTGSRASITITRGIISGFEETFDGTLLKTDSEINTGSSGGACVDAGYNLIGLPTTIIEEDSGQLGFVTPVSHIPQSWRALIRREKLR